MFGKKKNYLYRIIVTREYDIKAERSLDAPEFNFIASEGLLGGSVTFRGDEWPTAFVKERKNALTYKVEEDS